ncbi:LAMI_0C07316g1_1 [Lachancea mirantina]|uniref:LAMI_0C07316g1_1 n=1 Tax=Lachancea mirantina TaxID=1230905 RepID=A0A1G4J3S9_9SACH|nr:LAMI_0C07316g1_1 [Lachancea mirantina]
MTGNICDIGDCVTFEIASQRSTTSDTQKNARNGEFTRLCDHFLKTENSESGPKIYFEFLKKRFDLGLRRGGVFDSSNYCIDDDYEVEASGSQDSDSESEETCSGDIAYRSPTCEKPHSASEVRDRLESLTNGSDGSSSAETFRSDYRRNGSSSEVTGQIGKIFKLCGLPREVASQMDLKFDLAVSVCALKELTRVRNAQALSTQREIAFLRNLVRDIKRDWSDNSQELERTHAALKSAHEVSLQLRKRVDVLEEELLTREADAKLIEAREQRLRDIVETSLKLRWEVNTMRQKMAEASEQGNSALLHNYNVVRLQEENEELLAKLDSTQSQVSEMKCTLRALRSHEKAAKSLADLCHEKDAQIDILEESLEGNRSIVQSVSVLKAELSTFRERLQGLLDTNATLMRENEQLSKERSSSDFLLHRLSTLEQRCVAAQKNSRHYYDRCQLLEGLEQAHERHVVELQTEHDAQQSQQRAVNEQLRLECKTLRDTVKFYKWRLNSVQEDPTSGRKSRHERLKEAFTNSTLFQRSKSASRGSLSAGSSPLLLLATSHSDQNLSHKT